MKNNEKYVSRVIIKKTKSYLKISYIIFLLILISFSSILISSLGQIFETKKNYYDNMNTHIIEVSSKQGESNQTNILTYKDIEQIKNISKTNGDYSVFGEYTINFGIPYGNDSNSIFIYSFEKEFSDMIGLDFSDNNILYTNNTNIIDKPITLKIPVIENTDEGFNSNNYKEFSLNAKKNNVKNLSFIKNIISNNSSVIVSKDKYQEIVNIMFNTTEEKFENSINNYDNLGISPIKKLFVYSNDINNVDYLADQLDSMKYNTTYAFSYYDNIADSLSISQIAIFSTLFLALIIMAFNLIFSSELYYKSIQKDLGILKHYGYSKKSVFNIYALNLRNIMLIILSLTVLFNIIFTFFIARLDILKIILAVSLIEGFFILIVSIIIRYLLNKKCKKSTLRLLKYSKDFE